MRRLVFALILGFGFGFAGAEEKEGGIIGTGVVGEVTGLATFEVAGMRFNLPDMVELDGIDRVEDLRMGMTLSLRAERDGDGWKAIEVRRLPVLIGPITGANEVMGVPVIGDLPRTGSVIVDGFWSMDGVVATRITPTERSGGQVTGRYDPNGSVGAIRLINDLSNRVEPGDIVTVRGNYSDEGFTVFDAETGIFKDAPPDLLLAEGFFDQPNAEGDVTLLTIDAKMASKSDAFDRNQKIRRCALNGRFDYERSALSAADTQTIDDFCISAVR
ncbi:MAG: hypothetical protein AAGC79_08980 [Pseudomonadota bacterium]